MTLGTAVLAGGAAAETVSRFGLYEIHTFDTVGATEFTPAENVTADILIVAGGAMIRKGYPGSGGRLLLAGGERTIEAQVLGVTRNLRTAGEKTAYYVVCRYKDPVTGKETTYSSKALDEYPGKEVIGRTVTVHIDPGEKGKYTVEIDALLEEIRKEKEAQA